jgi:hypothetical protein
MNGKAWILKNCKFAQHWEDREEQDAWREQQMAPYEARISPDPEDPYEQDQWLLDGGTKYKILKGEDNMDGTPMWDLLEFDGKEWGITDEDYDLHALISRIDSKGQETTAPGLPSAPMHQQPQQPDPATRLYDLHGMGAKMTPDQATEYKGLSDQHKQQHGKLPGYMASWVRRNCKFAQAQGQPIHDPAEFQRFMAAISGMGFKNWGTGGGCEALMLEVPAKEQHILVTDDECFPPEPTLPVTIGLYSDDGDTIEWASSPKASLQELLSKIQAWSSGGVAQPGQQQPNRVERLYDLHSKGGSMTPEEAAEYQGLKQQHQQETGKLPGFMASTKRQQRTA